VLDLARTILEGAGYRVLACLSPAPALFVSGYPLEAGSRAGAFLQKPFSRRGLLEKLRAMLNGAP
jgi:hypothetical protein